MGGRDIFAARFTAAGDLDLVRVAGGTLDDVGYGIAIDAAGNPLYTGLFRQSIDADIGADLIITDQSGSSDMLLVKQLIIGGLDDATVHLTAADLAGFTFQFYGEHYDELFYSTNGSDHIRLSKCRRPKYRLDRPATAGFDRSVLGGLGQRQRRSRGRVLGSAWQWRRPAIDHPVERRPIGQSRWHKDKSH